MEFKDLVMKNRSTRGFNENRRVTREELLDLCDDARLTPSAGNVQDVKFYISCDPEEVEAILSATKFAAALKDLHLPYPGLHPTAFIVLVQDHSISDSRTRCLIDAGIRAQTITLGAAEKGLAGLMILNFNADKLRRAIALPEKFAPLLVIALGEAAEKIRIEDAGPDGNVNYWRSPDGVHHVPKRKLEDVVLEKK